MTQQANHDSKKIIGVQQHDKENLVERSGRVSSVSA